MQIVLAWNKPEVACDFFCVLGVWVVLYVRETESFYRDGFSAGGEQTKVRRKNFPAEIGFLVEEHKCEVVSFLESLFPDRPDHLSWYGAAFSRRSSGREVREEHLCCITDLLGDMS